MKHKSLREIQIIRESKKHDILNQVFGVDGDALPIFSVTPGVLQFLPLPIMNHSNRLETFSLVFDDPDLEMLGGQAYGEFQLVTNEAELKHWVSHGKVKRSQKWGNITLQGDVLLEPGQH